MRTRFIAAAVAVAALTIPSTTAMAADKDCSDFCACRQVLNFYKRHGGPKRDPHHLDGDHDGIACESLR